MSDELALEYFFWGQSTRDELFEGTVMSRRTTIHITWKGTN